MAATSEDTIMEEREELMVSPKLTKHYHPTLKISRFLKPSATSIDVKPFPFNPPTPSSLPKNCSLKASFNGWRNPHQNWKAWVDRMHCLHQSTWQKAGIEHAVLNSVYTINKNDELILRFAQKWRHKTNTFVFPWGEATITLQDIIVLGGYSVLGQSVLTPVETLESKKTLSKLDESISELRKSSYTKTSQTGWFKKFHDTGSEIEHEAFLALWLSRFVFPSSYSTVVRNVFPIAVHLASGNKLALAPAVLASIYRDLTLLKAKLIGQNDDASITIWAPLQILQIWIWERFPNVRPNQSISKHIIAKWDDKKTVQLDDNDSIFDGFCFRPYGGNENDDASEGKWVVIGDCLDEELETWIRCVRVSELVGIEGKCIEQYLPHRVAMQFGMDQDIPGDMRRTNSSPKSAWRFYARLVTDRKLYLPSRLCEPYVTVRYMKWLNNGIEICVKDELGNERSEELMGSELKSGLELEARIKRLEEVFAHLKAKKYCHGLI